MAWPPCNSLAGMHRGRRKSMQRGKGLQEQQRVLETSKACVRAQRGPKTGPQTGGFYHQC